MALMEGTRTGSEGNDGFDAFFRAEQQRLAALATVLCGDRETGRDLAQEALARTYTQWARVGRLERPGAWTRRVVVNLARDQARHRAVQRRRLPELARRNEAGPAVSEVRHDSEFWAAVATLSDRQRTAVALYYVGDRSISQVAEEMGTREGTVKATLHQARTRLREMLGEDHP